MCLEMMYAGDLLEQMQWDTLYHEHFTFYSLGTVQALLDRYGFTVVHAERIPMHGGSLRVVASQAPSHPPSTEMLAIEKDEDATALNDPSTWTGFGDHVHRKIDVVRNTLERLSHSATIWGYGAAGKATMWVNACGLTYSGRWSMHRRCAPGGSMPGTHTPIVFPDQLRAERTRLRLRDRVELCRRDPQERGLVRRNVGDAFARHAILLRVPASPDTQSVTDSDPLELVGRELEGRHASPVRKRRSWRLSAGTALLISAFAVIVIGMVVRTISDGSMTVEVDATVSAPGRLDLYVNVTSDLQARTTSTVPGRRVVAWDGLDGPITMLHVDPTTTSGETAVIHRVRVFDDEGNVLLDVAGPEVRVVESCSR